MPRYTYRCRTLDGENVSGDVEADTYREAVQVVHAKHPDHIEGSVNVDFKESTAKKVAEGAAIGIGCLGIGILEIVLGALPIALAMPIVIWVLRGCS